MSTATSVQTQDGAQAGTTAERTALPMRNDTFLGVFEAIGEDLGINANWLRVPFAALILWNPLALLGAYLALGAIVALSRRWFPARRAPQPSAHAIGGEGEDLAEDADKEEERLAA